ncbi:hypothetical protein D7193_11895 [Micromonospora costi]|uniref:Uncharacterized protein n=1 Tax=Micromonospora costi TaxID=1530042 RepID=A0A3B0A3K2_9ACTN|nr:hypothetical protein D7193_11895 [Micromonospora costi]
MGSEDDVPGTNARRQQFERGEIAWSPTQDMVLSVFRLRNEARFDWSWPHVTYDYFRYDIRYNGAGQGQARDQIRFEKPDVDEGCPVWHRPNPHIWARLQGFGEYAFVAKGCHEGGPFGRDRCPEGFAVPVRLQFGAVDNEPDPPFQVIGAIMQRWHELGASAGPLGRPIEGEMPLGDAVSQRFERGSVVTLPHYGAGAVVAAYQRGSSIEVNWGGGDALSPGQFEVAVFRDNELEGRHTVGDSPLDMPWARNAGSGLFRLEDPAKEGSYQFQVTWIGAAGPPSPRVLVDYRFVSHDAPLGSPARDSSPGHAYASHWTRVSDVARHYAYTRPLRPSPLTEKEGGENESVQFIAHLRAIAEDPNFCVTGELPSRLLFAVALRLLTPGQTGTHYDMLGACRPGDYDMAIKGYMTLLYRYRHILNDDDRDFILTTLIGEDLQGPHPPSIEWYTASFIDFPLPETENHILMIESSRYLVNQLRHDKSPDPRFDNLANSADGGLTGWLLRHLQRLAQHDFLEFNARAYQRLALHAIVNLYEFARDEPVRTAAQIILDYIAVKFAISSNRQRRVGPFRRVPQSYNSAEPGHNELLLNGHGDQVAGFGLMWLGPTDIEEQPYTLFPRMFEMHALIMGLSTYRPPTALYELGTSAGYRAAPSGDPRPVQHSFYHGRRPLLAASFDVADGGVEIYYRSPSFLISAGGMFLNSGYGFDELMGSEAQVAYPQPTTLMPSRGDWCEANGSEHRLTFGDLIRFEPVLYDGAHEVGLDVNTGVHMGFACGPNLRIPDIWLRLTHTSPDGPWFILNLDADLDDVGRLGFYVAAYLAPPTDYPVVGTTAGGGALYTEPQNLGLLYAVEAASMDFEAFRSKTLEANRLPEKFDLDGVYVFHAGDDNTFTFTFGQQRGKYDARVINMSGHAVVDDEDLSSLPLVEGPYLHAPGGHDGLVLVRYPRCGAPLWLDYRDALHPQRMDEDACDGPDGPLADRAQALIDVATDLINASRNAAHVDNRADAVRWAMLATETLRGVQPPPSIAARYLALFADTLHTLVVRLSGAGRGAETREPGAEAVPVYIAAAAAPGAASEDEVQRAERVMLQASLAQTLSIRMADNWFAAEAVLAQQACVDILKELRPPAESLHAYLHLFANALLTLVARLVCDGRPADAAGPGRQAVDAYRREAALPGADAANIADVLMTLALWLTRAGLSADAQLASQAADEIRPQG